EVTLRMVELDRVRDLLHDGGLAGLRRGHDEGALALADRHDQVDDPGGESLRDGLQAEAVLRKEWGEPVGVASLGGVADPPDVDNARELSFCHWVVSSTGSRVREEHARVRDARPGGEEARSRRGPDGHSGTERALMGDNAPGGQ